MENVNERFLQKCDDKKEEIKLHYIPLTPLGISYSRLNNFIALHMIAHCLVVLGQLIAAQRTRCHHSFIVPRACMCSGPPETRSKENQHSFDACIPVGMVYAALCSWRLCHGLRKQTLRWSLLRLMWVFLSLPCALTAYCPTAERGQLNAGALLYFVINISSILYSDILPH